MTTYTSNFELTGSEIIELQNLLRDCTEYLSNNPDFLDSARVTQDDLLKFIEGLDAGTRDTDGRIRDRVSGKLFLNHILLEFISLAHNVAYSCVDNEEMLKYVTYSSLLEKMRPELSSFTRFPKKNGSL